jgi:hypothetical protein
MRAILISVLSILLLSCSAGHVWVLDCTPVASDSASRTNVLASIEQVAYKHGFVRREKTASKDVIVYTRPSDNMGTIFMRVPCASSELIQVRLYEYPIVNKHCFTSTNVLRSLTEAMRRIPSCQVVVTNIVH